MNLKHDGPPRRRDLPSDQRLTGNERHLARKDASWNAISLAISSEIMDKRGY